MKRIVCLLALLAALALSANAATARYSYTFAWPICSATVSTNCLDHFSVVVVNSSGTTTEIGTFTPPPGATGAMTAITATFTGSAPVLGAAKFALLAVSRDLNGALLTNPVTPSNTTSATIYPTDAGGFALIFP